MAIGSDAQSFHQILIRVVGLSELAFEEVEFCLEPGIPDQEVLAAVIFHFAVIFFSTRLRSVVMGETTR